MTGAGDLVAKLAAADFRKIPRWLAAGVRHSLRRIFWHGARLRMHAYDALARTRRLPPGSLRTSAASEARADDRYYLAQCRRHGPVFKLFWGSGHLKVCVVGFPLARRMLNRQRGALCPVTTDITSLVPAGYLRSMNPPLHPKYRRLFMGAFRADLVVACEPELRDIVRRELANLATNAWVESPQRGERLYACLNAVALRSLLLMLFGIRPESEMGAPLEDAYFRLGPDGHVAPVGPEQAAAFHDIRECVLKTLQSMQRDDPARFADCVLRRLVQAGPDLDETVIGNTIYMVERGHHDLRDLLRWVLKYLSDHPPVVTELREGLRDPESGRQLAKACVLETLRLDQAEVLNRRALEAFDLEGFHVPRHSWVSILMRESHRDAATFAEPDAFRPHRFLARDYSADEYAPFGIDEHQCIAGSLVTGTGALFVEELVKGFTWSVTGDGPRRHGHFHWEPSPSFAIDIRPITAQ